MSLRRILVIVRKDLRDAFRDGRVLVLLALPIGLAVFYNATLPDDDELPTTTVAVVEPAGGALADELRRSAGKSVALEIRRPPDAAAARRLVARDDAEFAVVAPDAAAEPASATIFVGEDASPEAHSVVALAGDALARAAGREPVARPQLRVVRSAQLDPADVIEQGSLSVLFMIVMLVGFVAMMVVPIQMAEEFETGTFGALRLAATGPEILLAKALLGCVYAAAGVALTVALTNLEVHDPPKFFGAAIALVVSLVSFGLLLGLLVANSNAINTYGGFLLFPLVGLGIAAFFVDSGVLGAILDVLPFSQAARLLGDGQVAQAPYGAGAVAWAVIAGWALAGYVILARIAARREL